MTLRVLVCGGRDYDDRDRVYAELDALRPSFVMAGDATGADRLATLWVVSRRVDHEFFFARWKTRGKAAGPIRNQRMLDEGKPDLVLAFPGGRGTADMVARARKAGVEVREIGP